jgi:DNA-binding CsgD family transcriptional regulator
MSRNSHQKWTIKELRTIETMALRGKSPEAIAQSMQRTPAAVRAQLQKMQPLRVREPPKPPKPFVPKRAWTTKEEKTAAQMRQAGKSYREIGDALNRNPGTVRNHLHAINNTDNTA